MSETSLSPRYKTINPPLVSSRIDILHWTQHLQSSLLCRLRDRVTITLNRFQQRPHLVFDTDRPESAGGDVLETFRARAWRSISYDKDLLSQESPPPFLPIQGCPSPLLSQPGHVYVGVTRQRGVGTVGQALSEIPSYGWRTGMGDGIFDITLERRWLSTNCYDKPGRFTGRHADFFFFFCSFSIEPRFSGRERWIMSKQIFFWKIIFWNLYLQVFEKGRI